MNDSLNLPQSGDFQYVPVPTRYVPNVLRLVADLMSPNTAPPATVSNSFGEELVDDDFENPKWSDDDLIDFANKDLQTARNYRAIMKALANRVGEWTSIEELVEPTGLDRAIIKAFRTQIYRHLHKHYPAYDRAPFPAQWGDLLTPKRPHVVYYRVSEAQKEQWTRIQARLS